MLTIGGPHSVQRLGSHATGAHYATPNLVSSPPPVPARQVAPATCNPEKLVPHTLMIFRLCICRDSMAFVICMRVFPVTSPGCLAGLVFHCDAGTYVVISCSEHSRSYAVWLLPELSIFRDAQLGRLKWHHRKKARAAWAATHTTR